MEVNEGKQERERERKKEKPTESEHERKQRKELVKENAWKTYTHIDTQTNTQIIVMLMMIIMIIIIVMIVAIVVSSSTILCYIRRFAHMCLLYIIISYIHIYISIIYSNANWRISLSYYYYHDYYYYHGSWLSLSSLFVLYSYLYISAIRHYNTYKIYLCKFGWLFPDYLNIVYIIAYLANFSDCKQRIWQQCRTTTTR